VEVGDRHPVGAVDLDDLVLAQLDGVAGVRDERGDVGAEEVLALAHADHQRAVAAGGHQPVGLVGVGHHQGERPLEPTADRAHRGGQPAAALGQPVVLGGHQVGDDLGVGLGGELDAGGLALGAQRGEVLDDAVVDDRHGRLRRDVRVGVAVGRAAVGGPAGVPDPDRGGREGLLGQLLLQVGELARLLRRRQPSLGEDRDTS
jgi:hypothetical protein